MSDNVPRKLSTDRGSIHYDVIYKKIGVRFNGEERRNDVHAYDIDEGWIDVRAKNSMGQFKLNDDGSYVISRLVGTVEPFWKSNKPVQALPSGITRNDALHMDAAAAKRARKAERLRALAEREALR
jgi:hypothetical protein